MFGYIIPTDKENLKKNKIFFKNLSKNLLLVCYIYSAQKKAQNTNSLLI